MMTEDPLEDEWHDADDSMEVVLEDGKDAEDIHDIFPSAPCTLSKASGRRRDACVNDDDVDVCDTDEDDDFMNQLANISGDFASPSKTTYETATSAVAAAIAEPLEKMNTSIEEQVNTSLDSALSCCQWLCQDMGQQVEHEGPPFALISPDTAPEETPVRELWEERQQVCSQSQSLENDESTISWYLKQAPSSETATTRQVDNRSPNRSLNVRRSLFNRNSHAPQQEALNVTASLIVSDSESDGEETDVDNFPIMMESVKEVGDGSEEEVVAETIIPSHKPEVTPEYMEKLNVVGDSAGKGAFFCERSVSRQIRSLDDPRTAEILYSPNVGEVQTSPEKAEKRLLSNSQNNMELIDPIFEAISCDIEADADKGEPHLISFESSLEDKEISTAGLNDSYDGVYYGEELQSGNDNSFDGVFYGDDSQEGPVAHMGSCHDFQNRTETFENSLFVSADTTPEEFAAMEARLAAMHGDNIASVTKGEYNQDSLILSRTIDSTSMLDPLGVQYADQKNSTLQSVDEEEEEESNSIDSENLGQDDDDGSVQTEGATVSEKASFEPFSCDQSPLKCEISTIEDLENENDVDNTKEMSSLQGEGDTNAATETLLQGTDSSFKGNDVHYIGTSPDRMHHIASIVPSYESTKPQSSEQHIAISPKKSDKAQSDKRVVTPLSASIQQNDSFESAREDLTDDAVSTEAEGSNEMNQFFMTPDKLAVKRLSFADDHGQPLVLVRQLQPHAETAGRLVVLLMDPSEQTFEFILLAYPMDQSTTAQVLVEQLPMLATKTIFQYTRYIGLSRIDRNNADVNGIEDGDAPDSSSNSVTRSPAPTILDPHTPLGNVGFQYCELVLAVPHGSTSEEMIICAFPLLLNGTITKALQSGRRAGRGLKHVKSGSEWGKDAFLKNADQGASFKSREWNIVSDISETVVVLGDTLDDYVDTVEGLWHLADDDEDVFLHWTKEENNGDGIDGSHSEHVVESRTPVQFPEPPPDPFIWNYFGGRDCSERLVLALYFIALACVAHMTIEEKGHHHTCSSFNI